MKKKKKKPQADKDGATPLWRACLAGHVEIVKWLLASGRVFDTNAAKHSGFDIGMTALEMARKKQREVEETGFVERAETYQGIVMLLRECQEKGVAPLRTRLRKELGVCGKFNGGDGGFLVNFLINSSFF